MKNLLHRLLALSSLTMAAILSLTGCGTTSGYKQADKTGAGMAQFREEIINGNKAIDATMKALDEVAAQATTDPRKAFEQFSKAVKNLDSAAGKVRKSSEAMKAQGAAYFKNWEAQLAQVNNPEIRALAEQRKVRLQEAFEGIRKHGEPLKEQFTPWMSDLKDLEKYLSNDLTIAGVDAAKGLFSKASQGGMEVQKTMDTLIAELNTIAATITPAKVQPKK